MLRTYRWLRAVCPYRPPWHTIRLASHVVAKFDPSSPLLSTVQKKLSQRRAVEEELQALGEKDPDPVRHKELMKQLSQTEALFKAWKEWTRVNDTLVETEKLLEEDDPDLRSLAEQELTGINEHLDKLRNETFPSLLIPLSETAELSALMELKAGVGGSEASLFLSEIMRMYLRHAQTRRWKTNIIGKNTTESGGIKDAIVEFEGEGAYDAFRFESGIHRVQRVPATEASGRVHTSTVSVIVLPMADNNAPEKEDELFSMKDIRIEVMRARGAGGQHVNKTESAVRLTHAPTGITVSMQDERSQHQNRRLAFQVLRARLMDRKMTQEVIDRRDARRNLVRSADRSEKIRTYNYAQDRVTDHRLGMSLKNLDQVLDGDALQDFLDALAKKHRDDLLEEAYEDPS